MFRFRSSLCSSSTGSAVCNSPQLTLTGWRSTTRPPPILEGPGMVDRDHVAVREAGLADGRHPAVLLIHIL